MNVIVVWCIIIGSTLSLWAQEQEIRSRSFMLIRPASHHLSMHQSLWHNILYTAKDNLMGAFNITPYFQQSLFQDQTAGYFLIADKTKLLVAGDNTGVPSDQFDRDVRAEWLGLPPNFRGTVSLHPRQLQAGFWLEYCHHLKRFFAFDLFRNMWISLRFPLIYVHNHLNPCYRTLQAGTPTTSITNLEQAFTNPAWCYSKFEERRPKVNLSEIRVSVGRTFIDEEYFQLSYETTILIPMGSSNNPGYLFDPVVGLNNHAGFGNKVTLQVLLNRDPIHAAWTFYVNLEGILLIPNKQHRTFDLRRTMEPIIVQKQWSRFMQFTREDGTVMWGVNALTRKVTVKPYNTVDLSTGWRLRIRSFEWEVGYNLWTHGEELIEFDDSANDNDRYPSFGVMGSAPGTTASTSTISTLGPNDPTFVAVVNGDFEKRSAAAATALNHKAHFAFGITHTTKSIDSIFGGGIFVDVPQVDGALKTWGMWGKIGASF